ncbi:nuclear transport factor 2 family protein [Erythrobacter sp. GH1-10]|uniref:nuclear transport factor 2 family protein n=1 Tax=Erythrobacter sp. GH1-10 TaxID=3349334 RepID=UPI00387808C5
MRSAMIPAAAAMLFATPAVFAQQDDAQAAKARAVQEHVDAYRSGDLDRFVSTFTADATVVANGIVASGRQEIRALYSYNFVPGAPRVEIVESGMNGDRVYITVSYVFEDGGERCCSYSEYTVKGGKIARLETSG